MERLNKANKRSHGFDNETIQAFKDRIDENIQTISKKLKQNGYALSLARQTDSEGRRRSPNTSHTCSP